MRGRDGGGGTCTLLWLADKEAMVFKPLTEYEINGGQEETIDMYI